MARYSEAVIETIKTRLTLSEVISPYVRLTRKGDRFWGLCPFHNDKNPSFTVVDNAGPNGGFYKCFACGKGGGLFNFVMEIEHVDFSQAVEILAKKAGVELKEESESEKKAAARHKSLADLYNRLAPALHQYLLTSPAAEKARQYIKGRGISDETCDKFLLGYAPPQKDWMYNFLKKRNYSDELLSTSGLFLKKYDNLGFFRDRVMFPIRTWQGNCVAFSGRDLTFAPEARKYMNSPDTEIYSKRSVLFGFYESLPALKEKKQIIICEGNFDVISLHQAGLDYSCATCGTALTEEHIKLIKRYCDKVFLLFDSDEAGQKAAREALIKCQKGDLEGYVMKIEGAKDASELLEKAGAQAVLDSCASAVPGFRYLVSYAVKLYDIRQPKGKSSVFKEVKPYLDATVSEIERQGYIKYLADVLRIPEEQVANDYFREKEAEPDKTSDIPVNKIKYDPLKISGELNAMLLLLRNRDRFDAFRNEVKLTGLTDPAARKIYTVLEDAARQEVRTDDSVLQMIDEPELRDLAVTAFTSDMYRSMDVGQTLYLASRRIRLRQLEEKKASLQRIINGEDMAMTDEQEMVNLLGEKMRLDGEIQELKGEMEELRIGND